MKNKVLLLAAISLLMSGCSQPEVVQDLPHTHQAPLIESNSSDVIPGEYVVVLHKTVDTKMHAQKVGGLVSAFGLEANGVKVQHVYGTVLEGFAAKLSPANLRKLRADSRVKYISPNTQIKLAGTQADATWGLDRIDQRDLPLNKTYNYAETAPNVTVYVIDTGIRTTHTEFEDRASMGVNLVKDGKGGDCHGHGSHVAGIIGGKTYGVARQVKLVGVKVVNCQGRANAADLIAGINWVASNKSGPSVLNYSISGPARPSLDEAVRGAISKGVISVIAAGNDGRDACQNSPARVKEAIVVMNTDDNDNRYNTSNYGSCTDIAAPGTRIKSAYKDNDTKLREMTGTSMATPHVAGAAALLLAQNPNMTQAQVKAKLIETSSKDKIKNIGRNSPNRLLFVGSGGNQQPDEDTHQGNVNPNSSSFQPNGTKGFNFAGGMLKARLNSSVSGDFDLYLQKKEGVRWIDVSSSTNEGHSEEIVYNAASGQYRWEIYAYDGSGDYTLTESRK